MTCSSSQDAILVFTYYFGQEVGEDSEATWPFLFQISYPRHQGPNPVVLPTMRSIPITHLGTREMAPRVDQRTQRTYCELDLARGTIPMLQFPGSQHRFCV